MTGVDTDLATLREELTRFLVPRRGGKYPQRDYLDALARVEARCAQLQQALERIETIANEGPTWWDDPSAGVGAIAREALAGPDTTADSQEDKT